MQNRIDKLADWAFQTKATDLFLHEGEIPRVRTNNQITSTSEPPLERKELEDFWLHCRADPEKNQEQDTSHITPGGRRIRVNLYKSMGSLAAVLRPIKSSIPSLEELGAPQGLLTDWISRPAGLIIISGPTGSGKSTTLASALQWVNKNQPRHIVTIEDPIEYLFENDQSYFSQRELHADTPSFASALRASLRQSPDIILLGEVRDEETAKISLQAAETGHLVIVTLHSSGVRDSLDRLTNLFPHSMRDGLLKLLSQHLIGILSQQLLPRPDGGLLLAVEHLQNEAATRSWIKDNNLAEISDHLNRTDNAANCSFLRYLAAAVQQGYLETEVARQAAPNTQDFDRILSGIS